MSDNINLVFKNTISGVIYDKHGNILDTVRKSNILTDKAKEIFNKNILEDVNTTIESNKILGVVFSDVKFTKSPVLTIDDIRDGSELTDTVLITASNYVGTGTLTYGVRYSFTANNTTGEDISYRTFGLVTGYDLVETASHKLLSVLNCNIDIADGGSFVGDYIISISLKRG